MKISEDIKYLGVNDHKTDLFEGLYQIPNGMAYNSYIILDEKIAVLDTVDADFTDEWLANIKDALKSRKPDYLIVQHMEPDHSANILTFMNLYPEATIVASPPAFHMMKQFFGTDFSNRRLLAKENSPLVLGKHTLTFYVATMVHWPEVIVTYDSYAKTLFTADAFGKFGALDVADDWIDEARRYYIGIVGKYGIQVQTLLNKIQKLDVQTICSLHGPVLKDNLDDYFKLYDIWSSYQIEKDGVMIAYTSIYGNTEKAAQILAEQLRNEGCPSVILADLAREDMSKCIANAFCYGTIVLASATYNAGVFPFMREFIHNLLERNFQNRTVAFIENGTWTPVAAKVMQAMLKDCPNLSFAEHTVSIRSTLNDENYKQIDALAKELWH